MRKMTLAVGLSVLGVVGGASASSSDVAGARAQLQVLNTEPMVVRGVGFASSERVLVIARAGWRTYSKSKLTDGSGTFSVRFPVSVGECGRYWLKAFGQKGSRAMLPARSMQIGCATTDSGITRATDSGSR